ncbi:hypothetical protein ACRE_073700 [Hapsidospora chrysogenum ATCC 11550]|uniref:Uncharacterized protein n=1 Tax=Hapsidospora chrysogenum (strain ATCC 11550 / CBS 779.69 / DSM 880 / IAM 14645 / JCM 23072 / IMI 49137) TaxID=857340 RepID=A0A086SXS8_HAPC1|nr:hypothetical protein ACRE_073700 [Hapsidospora chrysogenum ATCC 11550]
MNQSPGGQTPKDVVKMPSTKNNSAPTAQLQRYENSAEYGFRNKITRVFTDIITGTILAMLVYGAVWAARKVLE